MSAEENRKRITEAFEDLARGDGGRFVALLDEDVTMTVTGDYSWSRTFRGKASVLRDLYGTVAELAPGARRTVADRILADGDWVVVEARGEMTNREGVPYRNQYCLLYRFADGRIVEMKEYQDSHLCERVLGPFPDAAAPVDDAR